MVNLDQQQSVMFHVPTACHMTPLGTMNERALGLIFEGSLEDGQALLMSSLVVGLHRLAAAKTNDCSATITTCPTKQDQPTLSCMSLEEVLSDDTPVDDPSWFQYYRYFFGMPRKPQDDDKDWEHSAQQEDVRTHVALFAYNLAVIQHEIGLQQGSLQHLAQARYFYQAALAHLDNNNYYHYNDTHAWLTLAAQNNLGHIYSFLGDCSGVLQCQQAMQNRLSALPATSWGWFRASLARASLVWTHHAPCA